MLTQLELEKECCMSAKDKVNRLLSLNEIENRAHANPYAKTLFDRFIPVLADIIRNDLQRDLKKPGKNKAHVALLKEIEPETASFIAVRSVLIDLIAEQSEDNVRKVCHMIGKNIQSELVMRQFAALDPQSFFYMQQKLSKRFSSDVNYRVTLVTKEIKDHNVEPLNWGVGNRDQIGAYILDKLEILGLVDIQKRIISKNRKSKTIMTVTLSDGAIDLIKQIKDLTLELTPYFIPFVEKPKDFLDPFNGGFHSKEMRKMAPAIQDGNAGEGDCSTLLKTINILQSVKWKVNSEILNIAKEISKYIETDEIVKLDQTSLQPTKPEFLQYKEKDELTEGEAKEFKKWKKSMTEFHNDSKLKKQKYLLMANSFLIAEKFKEYKEIYFGYFADFRGRCYARTQGISPQGSDLQKALLKFAVGKPVNTETSKRYFLINIANKFGIDKVSIDDRLKWVKDNHEMLLATANDPINFREWINADKPFQFLACCLEYKQFVQDKYFVSYLPVGFDGSCNGLQQFSALLRDEIGGRAVNLIDSFVPADIYTEVANKTMDLLSLEEADINGFRNKWIKNIVTRKIVKRSVMTLPYGSTRFSCSDFILNDYLKEVKPLGFEKDEYRKAANYLSRIVWKAIGLVVIKAREAMEYLQQCASKIIKNGDDYISWITPTGFIVKQDYKTNELLSRVRVSLFGGAQFSIFSNTSKSDIIRHKNGIAPNFIHSMDAAHMMHVANRLKEYNIDSIAMIHDDFGTHAYDADILYNVIREEFLKIYEKEDYLNSFCQFYISKGIDLNLPPSKGKLDIKDVLKSTHFFF